jgi:hypothetical protein
VLIPALSEYVVFYSAEDLRQVLQEKKHLLARIRVARRYDREATNARETIEVRCTMKPELE